MVEDHSGANHHAYTKQVTRETIGLTVVVGSTSYTTEPPNNSEFYMKNTKKSRDSTDCEKEEVY